MAKGLEGLGVTLRPQRSATGRRSLVSALEGRAWVDAEIDLIADHPRNPPKRVEPVTLGVPRRLDGDDPDDGPQGLVASVVEVGVLEPLILITAGVWLEHYPDDAELLGAAKWVAIVGNRRKAAALAAREWARARNALGEGIPIRDHVPGVLRDDLVAIADEMVLHENSNRLDLSPVDEALAFQRLAESGMSQRTIAQHIGISQGQVAKRLSLLKLPEPALRLVDTGEVSAAKATEWAQVPAAVLEAFEQMLGAGQPADRAMDGAWSAVTKAAALQRAKEEAEKRSAQVLDDPYKQLGSKRYYEGRLRGKAEIAKAAKAGTLAVGPGESYGYARNTEPAEPMYFTTGSLKPEVDPAEQDRARAERAAVRLASAARREGNEARRKVVVHLVATKPSPTWVRHLLVAAAAHGIDLTHYAAMDLGRKLAVEADLKVSEEYWLWRPKFRAKFGAERTAWVIGLAAFEQRISHKDHKTWDAADAAYVQLLRSITAAYELNEWEAEQLAGLNEEEGQES